MKATLSFALPEDAEDFRRAVHATDAYAALYDFSMILRGLNGRDDFPTAEDVIQAVNAAFYECLEDKSINLTRDYS
jgi:hypothetical protein